MRPTYTIDTKYGHFEGDNCTLKIMCHFGHIVFSCFCLAYITFKMANNTGAKRKTAINKVSYSNYNFAEIGNNISKGFWTTGPKPNKSKSDVWKTLMVIYNENKVLIDEVVYCPICKTVLKQSTSGSTSNLKWHIDRCKTSSVSNDVSQQLNKMQIGKNEFQPVYTCQFYTFNFLLQQTTPTNRK